MTLSIPLLQLQVHIEITRRSDEVPAPVPQHNWDEVRQQQVFHLLYGAAPPRR